MAFTRLQISNLALDTIGQQPITDIDSTTDAAALVLARQWDAAMEEFLAASPWSWAKTRERLQAASPAPDFGWSYRFALPDDFVSMVGVNEQYADTPSDWWEIESGYLLTDCVSSGEAVDIEYIAKPTDTTLAAFLARMDPLAVNALTVLLASKIAPQLCKDGPDGKALQLLTRYHGSDLPKARVRDLNMQRGAPRFPAATSTARLQRQRFYNR